MVAHPHAVVVKRSKDLEDTVPHSPVVSMQSGTCVRLAWPGERSNASFTM